jgi:hypothetical protein
VAGCLSAGLRGYSAAENVKRQNLRRRRIITGCECRRNPFRESSEFLSKLLCGDQQNHAGSECRDVSIRLLQSRHTRLVVGGNGVESFSAFNRVTNGAA